MHPPAAIAPWNPLPKPMGQLPAQVSIPKHAPTSSQRASGSRVSRSILLIRVNMGLGCRALGTVDDHYRRVRRHKGAAGVLREVLVAESTQNIDVEAHMPELHH